MITGANNNLDLSLLAGALLTSPGDDSVAEVLLRACNPSLNGLDVGEAQVELWVFNFSDTTLVQTTLLMS